MLGPKIRLDSFAKAFTVAFASSERGRTRDSGRTFSGLAGQLGRGELSNEAYFKFLHHASKLVPR